MLMRRPFFDMPFTQLIPLDWSPPFVVQFPGRALHHEQPQFRAPNADVDQGSQCHWRSYVPAGNKQWWTSRFVISHWHWCTFEWWKGLIDRQQRLLLRWGYRGAGYYTSSMCSQELSNFLFDKTHFWWRLIPRCSDIWLTLGQYSFEATMISIEMYSQGYFFKTSI